MITVCGQEFAFSALNAKDLERMEYAGEQMQQAFAQLQQDKTANPLEMVRASCRIFVQYITDVLGQDAVQLLGLDDNDLGKAMQAVDSMVEGIKADRGALDSLLTKYGVSPMNREQRRAVAFKPAGAQASKAARRQELLAQLAALEND